MSDEKILLYAGLTRWSYFPNQKNGIPEIPPCITSRQFTPYAASEISKQKTNSNRSNLGYDSSSYNLTRFNNASRELSIIHPSAYSKLVNIIFRNWFEIKPYIKSENSLIKPDFHMDGRIMLMNYEDALNKQERSSRKGFKNKFLVKADISNCFNSIYSHSIPWAMNGVMSSKINRGRGSLHNDLDKYQRICKRNETQGIPIGPATSNIVLEIILSKVDECLSEKGFSFDRHIDDYTCYCKNSDDANNFINALSKQLSIFKMHINSSKTKIIELPASDSDEWVSDLVLRSPKQNSDGVILCSEAIEYINYAINLNKRNADGSVLKFAISYVVKNIDSVGIGSLYDLVINLSWHYPVLIPLLDYIIFNKESKTIRIPIGTEVLKSNIKDLLIKSCGENKSDGIAWCLYFYRKMGVSADDEEVVAVVENGDCVSLTILNDINKNNSKILTFAKGIKRRNDIYELDRYWLLLYQLFREGRIKNSCDDQTFFILKKRNVNFIPQDGQITEDERKTEGIFPRYIFNRDLDEDFQD